MSAQEEFSSRLGLIKTQLLPLPALSTAAPPSVGNQAAGACGIIGYVGNQEAAPILMDGLRALQNRGYDSAGITTIDVGSDTSLVTTKFASVGATNDALQRLASALSVHGSNHIGMGHTRWATHGTDLFFEGSFSFLFLFSPV
jgi:hypothetical protein